MNDQAHTVLRRLRRFHEGVIDIDSRFEPVTFVIDGVTGRIVLPAPPGLLEQHNVTLHVPMDEPGAAHVFCTTAVVNPDVDGACDRFLIYFGKARWARWAALTVDSIKSVDVVLDDSEVSLTNPLLPIEASICRDVNKNPALLAQACHRLLSVQPTDPKLVGIDPYGLDVRAQFGPMRLEFDHDAMTEDAARSALAQTLRTP